jgi:hypothetical protein
MDNRIVSLDIKHLYVNLPTKKILHTVQRHFGSTNTTMTYYDRTNVVPFGDNSETELFSI